MQYGTKYIAIFCIEKSVNKNQNICVYIWKNLSGESLVYIQKFYKGVGMKNCIIYLLFF